MATPISEKPQILTSPETPKPFNYEAHTAQVRDKLHTWQFGKPVDMFEAKGLNKDRYIPWARATLFGEQYTNGFPEGELPERMGEVTIPEDVRKEAKDMRAILASLNVGYGHYRVALNMENVMQVMGVPTTDFFFGGPENIFDSTKGFWGKRLVRDIDRFARGVLTNYRRESLEDAYRQGLMHDKPEHRDEDPKFTKRAKIIVGLSTGTPKEILTLQLGKAAKRIFELREMTPSQVKSTLLAYRLAFVKSTRHLLEKIIVGGEDGRNGKTLVIATHGPVANIVGLVPEKVREELGVVAANFQPDVGMILGSYSTDPPTYTERAETAEKWGMLLGLPDGQPAPNTFVMDGYVTPLSVFERSALSEQRKQALENGTPLTVVATASGIAPAQLGAFKEFVTDHATELSSGKLRMVIQCGNDNNGGPQVYKELQELVEQKGITDGVTLHVAPTERAALEFFEALTWAPVPLAILVKGAEVARMAQALNIPHIPTGALSTGGHEIWNIAVSLFDNPESVVFPNEKVAKVFSEDVQTKFAQDILVQKHPEKYGVDKLLQLVASRTPQTPQEMTERVKQYILSGHQNPTNQTAMLDMIEDMLQRSEQKNNQSPK